MTRAAAGRQRLAAGLAHASPGVFCWGSPLVAASVKPGRPALAAPTRVAAQPNTPSETRDPGNSVCRIHRDSGASERVAGRFLYASNLAEELSLGEHPRDDLSIASVVFQMKYGQVIFHNNKTALIGGF